MPVIKLSTKLIRLEEETRWQSVALSFQESTMRIKRGYCYAGQCFSSCAKEIKEDFMQCDESLWFVGFIELENCLKAFLS